MEIGGSVCGRFGWRPWLLLLRSRTVKFGAMVIYVWLDGGNEWFLLAGNLEFCFSFAIIQIPIPIGRSIIINFSLLKLENVIDLIIEIINILN